MAKRYARIQDDITGRCHLFDRETEYYKLMDVTYNPTDKRWYATEIIEKDSIRMKQILEYYKNEKYQEITNMYDKACNFGTCPATVIFTDTEKGEVKEETYYCNRAWLGTWQEAITGLEYTKGETFVRLYQKYGDKHFINVTLKHINVEQYKSLYLQLIAFRFQDLQVKRNEFYAELEKCKTVEEIQEISVDFGCICVDEQNDTEGTILIEVPEGVE